MKLIKKTGKAYLVGAGPGDPGLLTVKAARLLREADLIIYDYLVNPDHLRYAREDAGRICVGKSFRHKKLSQDKINALIIQHARAGKTVVRLKGGDPYLFGRGAEEALFLQERSIPFEVVPGVTSATACAAYAGIPLTHRDHNSSVTFLTGHRAQDENLDTIDWEKIIGLNGTLVIYMGFYNLAKITERLIEKGMTASTKISVVEWGTLPWQKSCEGTLTTITARVKEKGLKAPAIIIVGEVVGLKNKLNWFEKLPLFGKKIVVTRQRGKNEKLRRRLEDLGAAVFEFPLIETQKLKDFSKVDKAVKTINSYEWVVFTSAVGVQSFLDRVAETGKDSRIFSSVKIASVGNDTSCALRRHGLRTDLQPARFEAAAIAEEFKKRFKSLKGVSVLLARAENTPEVLEADLKKLGASVHCLAVYKTVFPKNISQELKKKISSLGVDMITFTSSSTVSNFAKIMGRKLFRNLVKKVGFASIGPVTSGTLRRMGIKPACEAKVFNVQGLADAITRYYSRHS